MATLTGNQIDQTYQGLIKTTDNAALGAAEKVITDGLGTESTLSLGTTSASFTGDLDLTAATVTGLPDTNTTYTISSAQDGTNADIKLVDQLGNTSKVTLVAGTNITLSNLGNDLTINAAGGGAAGLVNGTGAGSMESAADLTTTAANAAGDDSIALGNASATSFNDAIAIGNGAKSTFFQTIAIGKNAQALGGVAAIAIGENAKTTGYNQTAIGQDAQITNAGAEQSMALGYQAKINTAVLGAVALGAQVTADKANTVSMKALDLQTASTPEAGGIIMTDAGSTERRLNITSAGVLQIDSTPVGGGGGAAGLVAGTGTSSMRSADTLVANPTQANGNVAVALGNGAKANGSESVAIGDFAEASQTGSAAIGQYAEASALYASAWGRTAYARSEGAVAFGQQAGVQPGFPGAVAMGRQVVGDTADTTHVRALKIVAPDGGIGGNGIIMLSPNGTAYKITVSDGGTLVVTTV